jgi:hypothetical protein
LRSPGASRSKTNLHRLTPPKNRPSDRLCFVDYDACANLGKQRSVCGVSWLLRVIDYEAALVNPELLSSWVRRSVVLLKRRTEVWTADKQPVSEGGRNPFPPPPGGRQGFTKIGGNFLKPVSALTWPKTRQNICPRRARQLPPRPHMPLLLPGVGLRLAASFRGQTRHPGSAPSR